MSVRSGGRILVDQLVLHGVDTVFCVPGESYLAALDALYDTDVRLVAARHETGAANMAEAYGKLTGRPGICFVTRGPGATHGSVGVHTALQDSTPLLYLIGQIPRDQMGREAFQEVDFRAMFAPLAKWAEQIEDPARIPEIIARAFQVATSGRPGPVVLALPEDVLAESADVEDALPCRPVEPQPGADELAWARALLERAQRPLMIVGGGGWSAQTARDATAFAEASGLPTAVSFRRQDYVDNRSEAYVGHLGLGPDPGLAQRVRDADVLLVVGARLGEVTTSGYELIAPPRPRQRLIHVHAGIEELGRVYQPELAINAASGPFFAAIEPVDGSRWASWREEARAGYLVWSRHERGPWALDLAEVVAQLRERLPAEAIVATGAGNFSVWAHRFHRFSVYRTQLSPGNGAMGYGVPAAVAAKIVHPERPVICFAGDGDFQMTGQELATAVQEEAAIVVLVVNNGMYGTIRMHQERTYPGRVIGTTLLNPDFAALARAYGAHGETVERNEEFLPAFERALASGRPALLELRVDPEAITPRQTISQLRDQAAR